jgi:hypothetical protein
MFSKLKLYMYSLGLLLAASFALPSEAAEWSRETIGGGELSRSATADAGYYSGSTTRTGPNGGSYTSSTSCAGGVVARCKRSYSGVGPDGQSFSGTRVSGHGPYRTRSIGRFTGPNGNTVIGVRRFRH